jgi:aspartate carbamoyltransferase catalytic subunit
MRMRTMHSILYALSQFDAKAYVVGPPDMALRPELKLELDARNTLYEEAESAESVIGDCDVIYMEPVVQADYTASRVERGGVAVATTPVQYQVTRELLRAKAKTSSIILHSLPRMDELSSEVDATRHARYWQEAFYGVVLRMSLLALVLGATE